jgi:hypothetical protein
MVHSLKVVVITDDDYQTSGRFTLGETIHFECLEFIVNRFDSLSLSLEGNDSGAVFVGMVHSGSPSLHTILKESIDEGDTTSSRRGSFGFPISRGCNLVTTTILIITTPPSGHSGASNHHSCPAADCRSVARHWAPS